MSRILQMRRGSAAENDVFTGLPGEVTFDTDTKTLRVHDGETLGGFALARADSVPSGGNIDLTTVPDDVWAEIVAAHTPAPYTVKTSALCTIPTNMGQMVVFSDTPMPFATHVVLVCQSPEAGYNAGDEVAAFGVGTRSNPAPNVYVTNAGLHVYLITGGAAFWVISPETGTPTNITNENWRILVRVYY